MVASKFLDRPDVDGTRQLHYMETGNPTAPTVICLHGVSRNARDFDYLASSLRDRYRVVAVDLAGRGKSDWLADKRAYRQDTYMQDMRALYETLGIQQAGVIGASMGGFLGIRLAAESRCWALGLIDIGPFMPRIYGRYVGGLLGALPSSLGDGEALYWLRKLLADPGPLSDQQWCQLLRTSTIQSHDGSTQFAFDPGIGCNYLSESSEDLDLWAEWEQVCCPVYVLRGQRSRVLPPALLLEMRSRSSAPLVSHELSNCGHCPHLLSRPHTQNLTNWLDSVAQKGLRLAEILK